MKRAVPLQGRLLLGLKPACRHTASLTAAAGQTDPPDIVPACGLLAAGRKLVVGVALSGGVDSAVAALKIVQQGHTVFGIFMRNWDRHEEGSWDGGCGEQDARHARTVAAQLGFPLHEVDFVREYWDNVFSGFLARYAAGAPANPDLACNRYIKFGALLHTARQLGAQALATGHYARLEVEAQGEAVPGDVATSIGFAVRLLRGSHQDQTYFLASVHPASLRHCLFPVGDMEKPEVRAVARAAGLVAAANRRSSRGICHIGPRAFPQFMAQYVEPVPGRFVCVESGIDLGPCPDILPWTVGQRTAVPKRTCLTRLYVAGKDVQSRVVYVAPGRDGHASLATRSVLVERIVWVCTPQALRRRLTTDGVALVCDSKAAYRQAALHRCVVSPPPAMFHGSCLHVLADTAHAAPGDDPSVRAADGPWRPRFVRIMRHGHAPVDVMAGGEVVFDEPVVALAPHQQLVLYDGDVVLGSAVMRVVGRTLRECTRATP